MIQLKIEKIQKFKGKINGILIEKEQLFVIINFAENKYYYNGFSWEKIEETAEDIFDNSETADDFMKKLKKL